MSRNKAPTSGEENEGEAWEDPDDSASDEEVQQSNENENVRTERNPGLSRAGIMLALARLPGLVAMKILTPAQANAMRATYQTMLAEYSRVPPGQQAQITDDNVLRLLQMQPEVLSMIEPFLTPDQVAMVMHAADDESDGNEQ
jgi:hypothetical protein